MSTKNRVVSISKNRVFPINGRAEYSYKYGNPVVQLEISPSDMKLVDTQSMRFNFLLNILTPITRNTVTPTRPNNQNYLDDGTVTSVRFNSRVGANAIIENLRILNFQNEVIEDIRGYGRLLASTIPAMSSFETYKNSGSCVNMASCTDWSQMLLCNGQMSCSLKLRAGILNSGQPLDLAAIGGLKINIQLAPDSLFLRSDQANAYYQISGCSLTYNSLNMEMPMQPTALSMGYPSYSSFINVLQSSDDTQSLMLNKSSVRACFSNFIDTSSLNNIGVDSMETNRLEDEDGGEVRIKSVVHLRNNSKFPRYYEIDEREAVKNDAYEAELGRAYLDAFRPFNSITSCLQSPETQGYKSISDDNVDHPEDSYVGGIAANYDQLSTGMGVEFRQSSYAVRIQSDLTDSNANTVYTFTLSNEGLKAKNANVQPVM